jgi:hypothetical protein
MPFLGNTPAQGFVNSVTKDDFTPNGTTTAFTLSKVATTNSIEVYVGNVRQEPTDAYSVSGTTLTMTEAPASSVNFYVMHVQGTIESTTVPPAGSIVANSLASTLDLSGKSVTYGLTDSDMPAGSVIQVVSFMYGTQIATTGTSYVDSGITLSITPSSTSSKILVAVTVGGFELVAARNAMYTNLVRGSTQIYQPNGYVGFPAGSIRVYPATSYSYLDSPATTSATTYKVQFKGEGGSGAVNINVNGSDSTITLMEIQG